MMFFFHRLSFWIKSLLLVTFFFTTNLSANEAPKDEPYSFHLITIGLGSTIDSRYGHTILQVEDSINKRAYFLNWGTFDFSDPLLPLNFFLGKLRYWVSNASEHTFRYRYLEYEKRPVFRQKINLTQSQSQHFMEMIKKNLQVDNIYFWYHFFYKNCATFPRDYLNELTGGQIEKALSEKANITFRSYVREYLNSPFFASFFLDVLMNDTIDYEISKWEETFYPPKLSEHLSNLPAFDENGLPREQMKLLSEKEVLYAPDEVFPKEDFELPFYLGAFFLIMGIFYLLWGQNFIWKINFFLWSVLSSILGATMVLAWIFSEHEVLKHNASLWFFWPFDLLLPIAFLFSKSNVKPWIRYLAGAHLLCAFCACLLWSLGVISQDIQYVMIYTLPAVLYFYMPFVFSAKRRHP